MGSAVTRSFLSVYDKGLRHINGGLSASIIEPCGLKAEEGASAS